MGIPVLVMGASGSGKSRSLNAHAGVNSGELVQLRHAWVLALRLTGELRLVGQDVDVLPCRVGSEHEVARVSRRDETPPRVMVERRPLDDLVFADVVDASFDAGEFGRSLAPSERFDY